MLVIKESTYVHKSYVDKFILSSSLLAGNTQLQSWEQSRLNSRLESKHIETITRQLQSQSEAEIE